MAFARVGQKPTSKRAQHAQLNINKHLRRGAEGLALQNGIIPYVPAVETRADGGAAADGIGGGGSDGGCRASAQQ